jgi:hypothetical protein
LDHGRNRGLLMLVIGGRGLDSVVAIVF